jgi:peptide/nickel transport system ATP-binding protein
VLELLRTLHAELGMAMLFITHDLAVVRQMTERVVVINRGEIVEAGPTDQVLQNPQHPYTRALIAAIPGHGRQPTVEADHDLKPTTIEGIEHDNHVERPV